VSFAVESKCKSETMEAEFNILVVYLIILLLLLFASVCFLFVYSGLLSPIDIGTRRPPFGILRIAYKFARGPYKNAGHLFTEAHSLIPQLKTIGVYYDDPQQVDPTDLRYCVGVVLPDDKTLADEHLKTLSNHGFKETILPAVEHAVITKFPFNNTISIFIGVARVYPKLAEYIQTEKLCAHPMVEIYDKDHIIFMAPLSRQDEFYVEETQEPELGSADNLEESETHNSDSEAVDSTVTEDDNVLHEESLNNGPINDSDDSSGSSFEELQH